MHVSTNDWLQAQYSVLGAALIDSAAGASVVTQTEETDYSGPGRTVFGAMKEIYSQGKPIDPVVVGHLLGEDYRSFLLELMEITPSCANLEHYIRICREQARVLQLQEIGRQLAEAQSSQQASDLLANAGQCMISKSKYRSVSIFESYKKYLNTYDEKPDFLPWPFPGFGDRLRVRPGRFVIIGAEPSVGKTAFALQCAWHWAKTKRVCFLSLETDDDTLQERVLAHVSQCSLTDIMDRNLSREDTDRVCSAMDVFQRSKLDVVQASGMTAADIRAKIQAERYEIVVIDYLQLMHAKGGSRYEQVTNISLELHTIAQNLGVTVVALSQLSRSTDEHTPRNADLRESGQLEQDADVILMMKLEKQAEPAGPRKLFVTKNKEGELFMTTLAFAGRYQTFSKMARTGEVVSKMQADGKRARQANRTAANAMLQMTMLPMETAVPFDE